jgi:hypothetical protein
VFLVLLCVSLFFLFSFFCFLFVEGCLVFFLWRDVLFLALVINDGVLGFALP